MIFALSTELHMAVVVPALPSTGITYIYVEAPTHMLSLDLQVTKARESSLHVHVAVH